VSVDAAMTGREVEKLGGAAGRRDLNFTLAGQRQGSSSRAGLALNWTNGLAQAFLYPQNEQKKTQAHYLGYFNARGAAG
jgi:hypothetical protein